jgi:putative ABC transport system ATP-binding protein
MSKEVLDLLVDLSKKNNKTLIMVTHDLNIAQRVDRIIYILYGKIKKIEEKVKAGG